MNKKTFFLISVILLAPAAGTCGSADNNSGLTGASGAEPAGTAGARHQYAVTDFGAKCDGRTDDSAPVQATFNAAGAQSHASKYGKSGQVEFPNGTCLLANITIPNGVGFRGQGVAHTALKFTPGNRIGSWMFASESYIKNEKNPDLGSYYGDLTIDGQKAFNTGGSAFILRAYNSHFQNLRIADFKEYAIIHRRLSVDGITAANGTPGNSGFYHLQIDQNEKGGIFNPDALAFTDGQIIDSQFFSNGNSTASSQVFLAESAGWHISGNFFYGDGHHALVINHAYYTSVANNKFDLDCTYAKSDDYCAGVLIPSFGAGKYAGGVSISNNQFELTRHNLLGRAVALAVGSGTAGGLIFANNIITGYSDDDPRQLNAFYGIGKSSNAALLRNSILSPNLLSNASRGWSLDGSMP